MNELLITIIAKLFALVAIKAEVPLAAAKQAFSRFMDNRDLSEEQAIVFMRQFEDYSNPIQKDVHALKAGGAETRAFFYEKLAGLANQSNREYEQQQKMWVVLQFIEFLDELEATQPDIIEFVRQYAGMLRISEFEFNNCKYFILGSEKNLPMNEKLLVVASSNPYEDSHVKYLNNPKIAGKVYVLHIDSTNTLLIKYFGDRNLYLNGRNLAVGRAYIFGVGSVIRSPKIDPIYYNKVVSTFTHNVEDEVVTYVAKDISYRFSGSMDGVHPVSFHARSGELIAIMGGSGVGKSTLLSLLSGQLKLRTGQITINGHDIHAAKDSIERVVGYVPQDDMLIEELTVYENLRYNAQLCFKDYTEQQIKEEVDKAVEQFDLLEAKDLKVGNPLNKFISGGQRKRLNIAMELLRRPSVLFVDEPTSGLSSIDSEKVMLLLKRQSLRGKIVVVNIHQPSSDLYKLFNRVLIMDHGGRVIFQGNPMDAIVYFKEAAHFLNPEESECAACGNVNTDLILKVVETRVVNEYGKLTRKRKRTSEQWYRHYMMKINPKIWSDHPPETPLPTSDFKIPRKLRQLQIFINRNIKAKIANRQYMLITLLEAPMLALILGYFTKYVSGTPTDPNKYSFMENTNIPSYLFMCVVAVIFFGLSASAQEIIKDRKILQRERFLHLSRNSYLFSKVLVMCIISAVQSLTFILVGNAVLEIQGLTLHYFAILFSASVCSNMVGLNVSSALNSEVAIYILIPLILVPQLLFSGVVVRYEKLHNSLSSNDYVPVVAEATISRWAYEALAVTQFQNNRYERGFFDLDMRSSQLNFAAGFWLPRLEAHLATANRDAAANVRQGDTEYRLELLRNELPKIQSWTKAYNLPQPSVNSLYINTFTPRYGAILLQTLDSLKQRLIADSRSVAQLRSEKSLALESKLGSSAAVVDFKHKYYNNALAEIVQNQTDFDKILESNARLFQLKDPIFRAPTSNIGRAHLYAPCKKVLGVHIGTMWFNIGILWFTSVVLYIVLYFDWLRLLVRQIEKTRLRKVSKRIARIIPS
ncbi:MAG: ATP-binding cassette domain-containing protein [Prevotellaceae bacterium]|jgi:ABC-type multidrug transport system ATPase subunit|nr:ATP-binding cassette domain-containing protein [Prevotellaceae bacterium]